MFRVSVLAALTIFFGACTSGDLDCSSSLCGCATAGSKPVTLRLGDADGQAIENARLICHDDGSSLGQTDANGLLSLQVPGMNTPGCGFMPDCQVAYFRTDNDSFGRHFWFARFVRGEPVNAKAYAVELVEPKD